MKIKKILSAFLACIMTVASIGTVAFAQETEAELMAIDPIKLNITAAGNDQRCKKVNTTDSFGRAVEQIKPIESTSNVAPAWFSDDTQRQKQINASYAYKIVKFVYYSSVAGTKAPTLSTWAYDTSASSNMASCGGATAVDAPVAKAGWNTAYFQIPTSVGNRPFHAFMFQMHGSDAASLHVNDTIYIGYIGLFDTLDNAKAYTTDFEGDISLSAIKVGGTAISGFDAATTTYTVDLAGNDTIPEITVTGTGNADNLTITKGSYDAANGTATATVSTGTKTYTLNFTGGSVKTSLTPVALTWNYNNNDSHGSNKVTVTDEYGRTHISQVPRSTSTNKIYPGGALSGIDEYKVLKLVYKTSESYIPKLSVNFGKGSSTTYYETEPAAGKWNTVYYLLNDPLPVYQVMFSTKTGAQCTSADYYYIGFASLFGSLTDAKEHKSIFEGELDITAVKVGDTKIGDGKGTYSYDVEGAKSVPTVSLTATGNTNDIVIEKGKFDKNGDAVTTIKNGSETLVTVNFTGGEPMEAPIIVPTFQWAGAKEQGISGTNTITDEFSRTYKQYVPALTYFENGSDLVPTVSIAPGGDIAASMIPEGFTRNDYKVMKVVYKSDVDYLPKLTRYADGFVNKGQATAQYDVAPQKGKWNVVYFDLPENFRYYQFYYTGDVCTNHVGEFFGMAFAGLFSDLDAAKAHKSAFEGEFEITDVLLDGNSIGNVTTYNKDLAGAGALPKLTVVATGDAEGVTITNGVISADGTATSTVKKGDTALVTVNFTGGSTEFKVTGILVDGKAIAGFDTNTKEYTMELGFAASEPVVTYEYQGEAKTLTIETKTESSNTLITKYVTTLKDGDTVLYTITFNVDTNKPEMLLNTLYKLNVDKTLNVAYLGGSVTSGTGSTDSNNKSWRGLTRDWLRKTFPNATINETNAAIGGTGAIFGVFRNKKQVLDVRTPDLLFIETVVNDSYDGTYNNNSYIRYTESIIKQTLAKNPKCDIVLIVTGDSGTFSSDISSGKPTFGAAGYGSLAELYDIPVIYVGYELALAIKEEFGANYSTSSEGWKKYFLRSGNSIDGVHPNDAGYAHYAKTIIDYMTPNLPTSFVPAAEDYKVKTNPTSTYSESKGYGSIMADADMIAPTAFYGDKYLGGFTAPQNLDGLAGGKAAFKSTKAGDVVSFTFNSSNLGIWTWSYSTANGKNGTDILYSIDGGEVKTANIYRSYANHKVYFLAQGLDNTKTHTIRIYHNDSANPVDIRWFLMWGMKDGEAAKLQTVPYFDFATEQYSVKLGGEKFASFNKDTKNYEIPLTLTSGQSYPTLEFDVRDDFYGYAVKQATADDNVATLSIDNVGVYTFEFVNGNSIDIKATENSEFGKTNGAAEFEEAAKYTVQLKKESEEWADATEYPAGTTKVTGLAAGTYNVRYIVEDGVYGITRTFKIYTSYPFENVYYVTDGGTGDGSSPDKAAGSGNALGVFIPNAVKYFGSKATTEKCYIILLGNVTHAADTNIEPTTYKDLVVLGDSDSVFNMKRHIIFKNASATTGKITFENININLGNPAAASGKHNDEIYINCAGNEITFKEFNTVSYATNASGQTRTAGIHINYFGDGRTGAPSTGRPVTVDCSNFNCSSLRLTGYNAGNETGDVTFVVNNVTTGTLKLGGHVNKETITGVAKAIINGGTITNAYASGDAAIINAGTVAIIYNGGAVTNIGVNSDGNTDEAAVDRVVILNNGKTATLNNKNKLDYILKGTEGGSADIVTANRRLTGFTFTTDKETVVINKGLTGEKVLTVENGTASIAVADLAAGEYTVTYEDIPVPEGIVEVTASIKLGRDEGTKPTNGNHLTVTIKNSDGISVKTIDLEDENTVTDENGCIAIDLTIDVNEITDETLVIEATKNGYARYAVETTLETLEEDLVEFFADLETEFCKGHGDIKGSFDAECGDGIVDIDDFIRIVRGFDPEADGEYRAAVDINEDGVVTVTDLAIVKANFGFGE